MALSLSRPDSTSLLLTGPEPLRAHLLAEFTHAFHRWDEAPAHLHVIAGRVAGSAGASNHAAVALHDAGKVVADRVAALLEVADFAVLVVFAADIGLAVNDVLGGDAVAEGGDGHLHRHAFHHHLHGNLVQAGLHGGCRRNGRERGQDKQDGGQQAAHGGLPR